MNNAVVISNLSLAGFYLLLLVPLALFYRWQLGLSKSTVTAVLRMTLQLAVVGLIHAEPWWQAQYLIPVAGMILGNALTANVLALERWYSSLKEKNNEYQFYLAMGAPHPIQPFQREAVKAALMPQLASMSTLGIVALPGMMTGQILGGTEPVLAVKYQLAIMIAILVAVSVSVAATLGMMSRFAFNRYGQLVL
ncbi:ABC transporter permease [Photobacterium halotolerans]|uniref:ABC transporter permease n=1 Tax=Photobacterium halotolerans TaxID=265726 RepID=UPI000421D74C|nr:ABC transporter permease [Photobacterium halotolerans]